MKHITFITGQLSKKRLVAAVALASGVLAGSDVVAQEEGIAALEEIVVTAERRSADVQDIPISMSVFNEALLEKKSVNRLEDLQFASPGLSVNNAGLTQSVNIRGIGLASGSPAVTNGVATYVDGLFQPPIVSANTFYDIADVQVLRGPQGTFAGANSTGGAVVINSKRPELGEPVNGYIEMGLGTYSARNAQGAVGFSLGDTFAVRAAMNFQDRDSYYNSVGTEHTTAGSLDEESVRLSALWAPTEALEIYTKYDRADKSTGGYAYRPIPTTANAAGRVGGIRDLSYNSPTANDETAETGQFEVSYALDNGVNLKWLSGYQEKEINNLFDSDGTVLASVSRKQFVGEDQISHEFNIISDTGEKLEWVVGGYYQKNKIDVNIANSSGVTILAATDKIIKGAFGQVGYFVTDDVQVEFGIRKAWFEAYNDPDSGVFIVPLNNLKVAEISGDYKDDSLLGKLSVNWNYDQNNLIYAFVAKGYKPGGINSSVSTFDGETVWSYEAGWKSTMLDGRLRTTASLFYNDYENFQNNAIDLTTGRNDVYNIAEATIQGVELSAEGQFGALRLDASFSYVDSELKPTLALVNTRALPGSNLGPQCAAGEPSNPPVCFDYTSYLLGTDSGPNLYAPEYSFTVGAEYEFVVFNGATLTPRLNYAWLDEQWNNLIYDKTTDLLKSRGLLSAMVTLEKDAWKVQAYGRNLTDKEYLSGQETNFNQEFYGAPREYGVNFTYNF